ncbi:MAG: BNR-4 repeat-containing protein [Cyclobacteriaceae bacterium]|nr:BNR-4 repeat-containing protein [Cyclobacteriaceae bacterium]
MKNIWLALLFLLPQGSAVTRLFAQPVNNHTGTLFSYKTNADRLDQIDNQAIYGQPTQKDQSGNYSTEAEPQMPWAISGTGGVYLLADTGELVIEIFKQDLNIRSSRNDFRAMLAGPDRQILDEVFIPHSGGAAGDGPGPVESSIIRTKVEIPGIYALMITTSGDRHGTNTAWAVKTNAQAYMIESARGHRDERHVEPIVLTDEQKPMNVAFHPRKGAFDIKLEGLSPDLEYIILYDDKNKELAKIPVKNEQKTEIRQYLGINIDDNYSGSAHYSVTANANRGQGLWRLHFPKGRAFVNIDGVTQWEDDDLFTDHCIWTPEPDKWFPIMDYRWMISPYQLTVHKDPGIKSSTSFMVYNHASEPRAFRLSLIFPDNNWPVELSENRVMLNVGQSKEIEVLFTVPDKGQEQQCYIQVITEQSPDITTYASLTVKGEGEKSGKPLDLPVVLKPFIHENRQFGYLPDYPVDNQVYFDLQNRPYVVSAHQLYRKTEEGWISTNISEAVNMPEPDTNLHDWTLISTKIAFDKDDHLYLLASSGQTVALLHSADYGVNFNAFVITGRENARRTWDFESFSGNNIPEGPPPVLRLTETYVDDADLPTARRDPRIRWRRVNDLELIIGDKSADGLISFRAPIMLTKKSIGISMHSGIPSSIASIGSNVHVVWGEATDPAVSREEVPGVPAYVATYNRISGALEGPVFMDFGAPPNDVHNTPGITIDSKGFLHVVVGTHGQPFQYLRSLKPNDGSSGWTNPVRTSEENLRQTYVGLVCDSNDVLHVAYRLWQSGNEHHDGALWAALAFQRKQPGKPWEDPVILMVPPFSDYSIYYHRLTIDREGNIYISYDYWSTMWFYRNQRGPVSAASGRPGRGWGRAVLTSGNGGDSWKLW